jgi:hypothetical protein
LGVGLKRLDAALNKRFVYRCPHRGAFKDKIDFGMYFVLQKNKVLQNSCHGNIIKAIGYHRA